MQIKIILAAIKKYWKILLGLSLPILGIILKVRYDRVIRNNVIDEVNVKTKQLNSELQNDIHDKIEEALSNDDSLPPTWGELSGLSEGAILGNGDQDKKNEILKRMHRKF